jgi:hypothetical protein
MTAEPCPGLSCQLQLLGGNLGDVPPCRAKVEWHTGWLYPHVGLIVTNLSRPTERVTKFYNGRGEAKQHIKEGKHAINWMRLSCHGFRNNEVRL